MRADFTMALIGGRAAMMQRARSGGAAGRSSAEPRERMNADGSITRPITSMADLGMILPRGTGAAK